MEAGGVGGVNTNAVATGCCHLLPGLMRIMSKMDKVMVPSASVLCPAPLPLTQAWEPQTVCPTNPLPCCFLALLLTYRWM